jgi:Zn finger protein HypA/HybF involved in hydrogenase expression
MHELSLMLELREQAQLQLQLHQRRRVVAVVLRIGEAACVDGDALALAFDCTMAGTPLEGAALQLQRTTGRSLELVALELQ